MEEVMLQFKLDQSKLDRRFKWRIETTLTPGVCHHLTGPNGIGKSTFLEELKLQWKGVTSNLELSFVDQNRLFPMQDLTVEGLMDVFWDVTAGRHEVEDWRALDHWKDPVVSQWLHRLVSELSGGENQWLKILMMRSIRAQVWLLDEPFQSLDHTRQVELWKILEAWIKDGHYLVKLTLFIFIGKSRLIFGGKFLRTIAFTLA